VYVDAATRETYEKIRVGGSWDDLLSSLSLLRENRARFMHVGITMVVMKANYREIPVFVDFAESYGLGASFQKIVGTYGDQNIFEREDARALDKLRKIIAEERSRERSIGVCWNNLLDLM
jgi:MoaA/NifB/PqqE/SkfB family radical SAM enzyme